MCHCLAEIPPGLKKCLATPADQTMKLSAVLSREVVIRKATRKKEKRPPFFISGLMLLQLIVAAPTLTAGTTPDYAPQRSQFLAAEKAFSQGDKKRYKQLKSQLTDYPLYPYLEYRELKKQLSVQSRPQVEAFLTLHEKAPIASRLRRTWLKKLAKRQAWEPYLVSLRPGMGALYECNRIQALLATGHTDEAMQKIPSVWLKGKSQPDACDPVFSAWEKAGGLTGALAWERIELAMKASNRGLARYLKRYLPAKEQKHLELWLKVHRKPEKILNQPAFSDAHPFREKILLHGFKRLAWSDLDAAIAAWPKLSSRYPFSDQQLYQAERSLMLSLVRSDRTDAINKLDSFQPNEQDDRLLESRIRAALSRQEWNRTIDWINALPSSLKTRDRWRYWLAKALAETGKQTQAETILDKLANERSYYGFLAADQLDKAYRFAHDPLEFDPEKLEQLSLHPGIQRAHELFILERFIDARREWRQATRDMKTEALQLVSKLAQKWGWHDQAIFTLARTGYWDDLELRFPLEHKKKVLSGSNKQQLDNAWVFAVIRQESAFSADAHSPAGARGLMQLMPRTARFIAKKANYRRPKKQDLYNPEINIKLGTAYLSRVLNQLGNNPVLATAAYNAGPHRVRKWLPEGSIPADIWVEVIPFRETRRYTQRVLSYAVIYDRMLGKKVKRLRQRMPPIDPVTETAQTASPNAGSAAL